MENKTSVKRRKEILNVATKLFVSKGFDNTSMNQIREEAGISKGLIYHYFKDKDELIDQVIVSLVQDALKKVEVRSKTVTSFSEKMAIFIDSWFELVFLNSKLVSSLSSCNRCSLFAQIKDFYMTYFSKYCTDVLKQGQQEGVLTIEHPVEMFDIAFTGCAFTTLDCICNTQCSTLQNLNLCVNAIERVLKLEEHTILKHIAFDWHCNL